MSWTAPPDILTGTRFEQFPSEGPGPHASTGEIAYVDVSLESPAAQFAYLVSMLEAADAKQPAPFTGTPPWGEPGDPAYDMSEVLLDESYAPTADVEASASADLLSVVSDSDPAEYGPPDWQNDEQYHGLGVPPGVENLDQPIESGHTQAVVQDPSAEHGWDAWSGRPQLARVARHENNFPGYAKGTRRRMGDYPVEKMVMPYALLTQQYRDMLLIELKRRGVHNAVVADVPSVPFTEQVQVIDPTVLAEAPDVGPEGVLPF